MRSGFYFLLLSASILMQVANAGDKLVIPGHVAMSEQVLPKRGISMDQVMERFGEPDDRVKRSANFV